MASLRSRAFNTITRIIMRLLCSRASSPVWFRDHLQRMDGRARLKLPPGIQLEEYTGTIAGRWLHSEEYQGVAAAARTVVLYLHGGAFVMRMPVAHSVALAGYCAKAGMSAFMPWYRLAPEHPFPAAPEDCLSAYRYLLNEGYLPENIVVMGDSAGGNLTLALMHYIRDAALPMPRAAIMLSPVLDMAQISASWRLHTGSDPMYCVQAAVNPVAYYLPVGADLLDPRISPCYGDFSGFPPLLTLVGSIECLLDDSVSLVKKAVEAGVNAEVHIWVGMPHVFTLQGFLPETPLAVERILQWLNTCTGPARGRRYDGVVRVFDRAPLWGKLREFDNNKYLANALEETV